MNQACFYQRILDRGGYVQYERKTSQNLKTFEMNDEFSRNSKRILQEVVSNGNDYFQIWRIVV